MNTSEEIWKDIPEYEGYYQVSNRGHVRSVTRQKRTRFDSYFWIKGCPKRPHTQADGYLQIGLSKDGTKKSYLLHRIVACAFIPGDTSLEVNHKDFNRKNNCVENLEWVTRIENVDYSHRNGRLLRKYERGVKTKLNLSQVIEIRKLRYVVDQKTLSKRFDVSVGTVSCIQRGVLWKR